jgi:hypothetical protein
MTEQLTNDRQGRDQTLQKGCRHARSALFEPNAQLFDDGRPRSLDEFAKEALGRERFTSIEEVTNGGPNVVGQFHSDPWGDFRTDFNFRLSSSGQIVRRDIGQAT